MKLKIKDGIIYNEIDVAIGTVNNLATDEDLKAIQIGSEAVPMLEGFVSDVETGRFKPKALFNTFKSLLEKYN